MRKEVAEEGGGIGYWRVERNDADEERRSGEKERERDNL